MPIVILLFMCGGGGGCCLLCVVCFNTPCEAFYSVFFFFYYYFIFGKFVMRCVLLVFYWDSSKQNIESHTHFIAIERATLLFSAFILFLLLARQYLYSSIYFHQSFVFRSITSALYFMLNGFCFMFYFFVFVFDRVRLGYDVARLWGCSAQWRRLRQNAMSNKRISLDSQ